jgi:hypothetical protein
VTIIELYEPKEPYIISKGKKRDKSLEQLMFQDYDWLVWMRNYLTKQQPEGNVLLAHITWVLEQGDTRQTRVLCPQCNQRFIQFFSVRGDSTYGYSMGGMYACCAATPCQQQLIAQSLEKTPTLFPLQFSVIEKFHKKDRPQVVRTLKECFGLPRTITKTVAFNFLTD